MPSRIGYLKWIGLGLFFVCSAAITAYQWLYAIPHKKCEAAGNLWSDKYRECYRPVFIVDLPGFKASKAAAPAAPAKATSSASAGHP